MATQEQERRRRQTRRDQLDSLSGAQLEGAGKGEAWMRICRRLRVELGEEVFATWFGCLELDALSDQEIYLLAPTKFLKSWIQSHYADRILASLASEFPAIKRVSINVRSSPRPAAIAEQKFFVAKETQYLNPGAVGKPAPFAGTTIPRSRLAAMLQELSAAEVEQEAANLLQHTPSPAEERSVALWDKVVESLGRSADVLQDLAESTGEAIARIAARGDRIDRIQNETRILLNALVAPEADA